MTGLVSEPFIQDKVTKRLKPQFHWEHIKDRQVPGKSDGRVFWSGSWWRRSTRTRRAGCLPHISVCFLHSRHLLCLVEKSKLSTFSSPDITRSSVLWREMMEGTQPTGNLQRFLVLCSLAGTVSVDGFGQQDDHRYQETQKQHGAQSDDKRHIPGRWGIHVLPQDLVGDPWLK